MKNLLAIAICAATTTSTAAPPIGDIQGTVAAVRVRALSNSVKSFEVWFSQTQNDRWSCLATNGGYVVVYENGYGVTPESYKQMFALAVMAQAVNKSLALDSAGTGPCTNVNQAWIVG